MKIHEYQAKQILAKYGVTIPRGKVALTVDEAVGAAKELGTEICVVKAQIHAGGRGKGGGVKISKGLEAVRTNTEQIIGMQLVTHQTGPKGRLGPRDSKSKGSLSKKEWTSRKNFMSHCWLIEGLSKW